MISNQYFLLEQQGWLGSKRQSQLSPNSEQTPRLFGHGPDKIAAQASLSKYGNSSLYSVRKAHAAQSQ